MTQVKAKRINHLVFPKVLCKQVLRIGKLRREAKSQKKRLLTSRQPGSAYAISHLLAGFQKGRIPIYPNTLPTVPKPSKGSRTPSLVFSNLPASQSAITRLLNRCRG